MQFVAFDEKFYPISAFKAKRQKNYFCLECKNPVRVRQGPCRIAHFFHLNEKTDCSQKKKSLEHLMTQQYINALIPETILEHIFPSIGRIADVAWIEKKRIFEVQCSPLSLNEAKERIKDYGKLGFEVLFILHDKRYNRRKLTPCEAFLRKKDMACFTNINARGEGIIYNQIEVVKKNFRFYKNPPQKIDLLKPFQKLSKSRFFHHLLDRILGIIS